MKIIISYCLCMIDADQLHLLRICILAREFVFRAASFTNEPKFQSCAYNLFKLF